MAYKSQEPPRRNSSRNPFIYPPRIGSSVSQSASARLVCLSTRTYCAKSDLTLLGFAIWKPWSHTEGLPRAATPFSTAYHLCRGLSSIRQIKKVARNIILALMCSVAPSQKILDPPLPQTIPDIQLQSSFHATEVHQSCEPVMKNVRSERIVTLELQTERVLDSKQGSAWLC